jgi:microcystin-dependent protein
MSQHDFDITKTDANAGTTVRAAINAALQALASNSSGVGSPTISYAYQFRVDTSVSPAVMYMRNGANSVWVRWGTIDASTSVLTVDKAIDSDKIKASSTDTTSAYLNEKLIAGSNVTITKGNTGSNETLTFASTASGMITGTIIMWPTSSVPTGYFECNGAAVSRTTYSALFAVLGTLYGAGDGSTTFNIPDYRGYFLRGWDHGTARDPDRATRTDSGNGTTGDNVGTKQSGQYYTHTHTAAAHTHSASASASSTISHNSYYNDQFLVMMYNNDGGLTFNDPPAGNPGGWYGWAWNSTNVLNINTSVSISVGSASSGAVSSSGGNENRPLNVNIMYCIKY